MIERDPQLQRPDDDPRLQLGAYITDGTDLYEVIGEHHIPMSLRTLRIVVENCHSLRGQEVLPESIRNTFNLVRHPPVARCPDVVDEIPW